MSPMQALSKFKARSPADRWRLTEAAWWLGVMRLAIVFIPLRRIVRAFGVAPGGSASAPSGAELAEADHVGTAVRTCASHTPWQSACLAQALAAMAMLRRRRISSLLCLGVAERDGAIRAHAWVCCGDVVLTGAAGSERYTVIGRFAW
jgi:hypothetical protein